MPVNKKACCALEETSRTRIVATWLLLRMHGRFAVASTPQIQVNERAEEFINKFYETMEREVPARILRNAINKFLKLMSANYFMSHSNETKRFI